jgi:hypothetical protein
MSNKTIFVVRTTTAATGTKVSWPDSNSSDKYDTVLKTIHNIDYENYTVQIDGENGPVFNLETLPEGVGFYTKITNIPKPNKKKE